MPEYSCINNIVKNSIMESNYQEVINICDELLEQLNKEPMENILPKHKVIELKARALVGLNGK